MKNIFYFLLSLTFHFSFSQQEIAVPTSNTPRTPLFCYHYWKNSLNIDLQDSTLNAENIHSKILSIKQDLDRCDSIVLSEILVMMSFDSKQAKTLISFSEKLNTHNAKIILSEINISLENKDTVNANILLSKIDADSNMDIFYNQTLSQFAYLLDDYEKADRSNSLTLKQYNKKNPLETTRKSSILPERIFQYIFRYDILTKLNQEAQGCENLAIAKSLDSYKLFKTEYDRRVSCE